MTDLTEALKQAIKRKKEKPGQYRQGTEGKFAGCRRGYQKLTWIGLLRKYCSKPNVNGPKLQCCGEYFNYSSGRDHIYNNHSDGKEGYILPEDTCFKEVRII